MTPSPVPGAAGLVGRDAELATLLDGLDGALGGEGHVFCLAGEPGIGKTRLAAALAAQATDRGARVLWGRCSEDAGAPAYWPWIQILRGCIRDQEPEALLAQMGAGAADIVQVVTQLREWLPRLPSPPALAPEQARFRFFDSMTTYLTNAAQLEPLVLILDDLHRADTSSLLLLEFLGRELHASRLLVVGTYRDIEVDRAHPLARTLAAVIGSEFGLTEFEGVGELTGDALLEALEQAEVARVIAAVPGGFGRFRFTHALIREALYDEAPAAGRIRLHRQVAEALEALYGSAAGSQLGQLAHHFCQAAPGGEIDKAVAYARLAGHGTLSQLAYEEAARCYQMALQALELRPRVDEAQHCALRLALGEAQNWSGEADAAKQTFQQAAVIALRLADAEGLARAALGYGAVADAGTLDTVRIGLLQQVRDALGERDSLLRVRVLADLSGALYWSKQPDDGNRLSEQALAVATRLADPAARAYALDARREALWRPERLPERLALGAAMREQATAASDQELRLWACRWLIADSLACGDRAAMDNEIAAHAWLAQAVRQPLHLWYAVRWQAMRALLVGRFGEAEELIERAGALGRRTQRQDAEALSIVQWAALRRLQGRAAEVEPVVREVVARNPDVPVWRAGLAAVYADLGLEADARREFERVAAGGFAGLPRDANWLVTVTSLAQACAFLRDHDRAAVLYDLLLPYRDHIVVVGAAVACHGAVAAYLGLLANALARWDAAQVHFAHALALYRKLGARPWIASAQYDYATTLLASAGPGDRAQAQALVTQALGIAQELAMTRLAARALAVRDQCTRRDGPERARRRADARPRAEATSPGPTSATHPARSRPETLTARELEVARLLAQGLTNRQIAASLVIAERTADAHVANILGKLSVRSRAQVAAWAVERGLHTLTDA